ncbi:MAG: heme ABC exporter ATP-binding protein CcmA [Alphaproteobacteria bacterium]|nr:heme ABC exporter ATP-binding protein CcmA [Alphaproteobacteria bacterium]
MLKVQNLACRRTRRVVFREIELEAEPGMVWLVTGPNGSGKSSLLRVLAGILGPMEGKVTWQGEAIDADPAAHRARIHYIGHVDALKSALTVRETLAYWRALHGGPSVEDEQCLGPVGLAKLADRPVQNLSAGQKKRLSLARLALHDAPLWLLDEPLTSLDAAGRGMLGKMIDAHAAKGGIVIAATHDPFDLKGAQFLKMEAGR